MFQPIDGRKSSTVITYLFCTIFHFAVNGFLMVCVIFFWRTELCRDFYWPNENKGWKKFGKIIILIKITLLSASFLPIVSWRRSTLTNCSPHQSTILPADECKSFITTITAKGITIADYTLYSAQYVIASVFSD